MRKSIPKPDGWIVVVFLVYIIIIMALTVGWVMNIVSLIGMLGTPVAAIPVVELILRLVGLVVTPLGGILGYF